MKEIKFKAVMQRLDGTIYISDGYSNDSSFLSYLFDFENNRWDEFLDGITTEQRFVNIFPDDDEDLKGWSHIENIQYTGFKIKDIEIYDGYLIKGRKDYIYEVRFIDGAFYLYHIDKYDGMERMRWGLLSRLFHSDMKDILKECEVIGSVYENKDLLNGSN